MSTIQSPALCSQVPALKEGQDYYSIVPEHTFKYLCFAQSPLQLRALPGNAPHCPLPGLPPTSSSSLGSASRSSWDKEHNAIASTSSFQKRYYLHSHLPPPLHPSSLLGQHVFPLLQLTLDETEHAPTPTAPAKRS